MLALAVVLWSAVGAVFGGSVIFRDCGSQYELQSVSIEGCRMALPCYITVGESPEVTAVFTADFSSKHLDQDVTITLNFINLHTSVTPEPCASTGCPVSMSQQTTIVSKMYVPKNVAINQRGWLRWRVYNEMDQMVLCYNVMVQTQSPLQMLLRNSLQLFNTTQLYHDQS